MEKFQKGMQLRAMAEYVKDERKRDCSLFIWGSILKLIDPSLGDDILGKDYTCGFSEASFFECEARLTVGGQPSPIVSQGQAEREGTVSGDASKEEPSEPEEFICFDYLAQAKEEHSLKYLYQCLLAFRSSEPGRVRAALEDLPYILLKHLHQTEAVEEELIEALFTLHDNGSVERFDFLKLRCLVVLVLVVPKKFARRFSARFFLADVSLGERMHLLTVLDSCLWEILGRTNQQSVIEELLDAIEGESSNRGEDGPGLVVVDEAQSRGLEVARQREDKLEGQSRRWGYAKKGRQPPSVFAILQTGFVDRVIETLKPVYYLFFLDTLQYASSHPQLFHANPILLTLFYKVLITFCQVSSTQC